MSYPRSGSALTLTDAAVTLHDSQEQRPTILAIDVGTTLTKLAILAPVSDRYRLVADVTAPTTAWYPYQDAMVAVRELLRRLEVESGWRLLDEGGMLLPGPVIAVTTSISPSIPALIIATTPERVHAVAQKFERLGYTHVVASLALEEKVKGLSRLQLLERQLRMMDESGIFDAKGVVVVDITTRKHAARVAALLRAVDEPRIVSGMVSSDNRPVVLFAGSDKVAATLEERVPQTVEFRQVSRVGWFQPTFDSSQVRAILGELSVHVLRGTLLGLTADPGRMDVVMASSASLEIMTRLIARVREEAVAVASVGGRCTAIYASGTAKRSNTRSSVQVSSMPFTVAEANLGTSSGLESIIARVPMTQIARWLPFDIDEDNLRDYLANRWLRDKLLPQDVYQLLIEHAVMRECLLTVRMESEPAAYDLLIASGGIARQPRIGQTVLLLLDALQPLGLTRLLLDNTGMLARLGAVARVDGEGALSVLQGDVLVDLGPCLAVTGRGKEGEIALHLRVQVMEESSKAAAGGEHEYEIRFGTIVVVPLEAGQRAHLYLRPTKGFHIDIGRSYRRSRGGEIEFELAGGVFGLVVDARGRPLALPEDRTTRQARIMDWLQATDAIAPNAFSWG
jgi:hypothetical protein